MIRSAIVLAAAALSLFAPAVFAQNLLNDGSFEVGLVPTCNMGNMPDTWYRSSVSPDTYSFDCTTLPGLTPLSNGNFTTLAAAHDGLRYVAGAELGFVEAFGQALSTPLVPDQCYALAGYFVRSDRSDIDDPGVYDIYLSSSTSINDGVLVASIGSNAVLSTWTQDAVEFIVPSTFTEATNIIMSPRTLAGGTGSYLGSDSWSLTTDCVVAVEETTWGQVKGQYR